ncbi:unnamed protein product [Cuscuta campestris]|uniref:Pentacotripeptide-repeat region of PRORP domain-containing protein n=1 Tax=Cuscuta campestris TaxID=132261 RepID=A0A484K1W1_9ASTE|nr:unnamed protein product [Cuscuta campestris]
MPPSLEISSITDLRVLVHGLIVTSTPTASSKSPYVFNNILSMYARCGSLKDARDLFDHMPQRNVVTYNALISSYSSFSRLGIMVFQLLARLQDKRLVPNASIFTSLLQASSTLKNWTLGSVIHAQCLKILNFSSNVRIQTSLLGMYSNCGDLDRAIKVFRCMDHKDSFAWDSLILGHIENGELRQSFYLFKAMLKTDVSPTRFTYSILLSACSRLRDYHTGKLLHAQLIISAVNADLPLHNALLDMYCNCGDTIMAFNIFKRIDNPDSISCNSMISGYAENGDGENAMRMFVEFARRSLGQPDEYTFAAVISATSAFPSGYYGKPLHAQVAKTGLASSTYVGSTLLAMYFCNKDPESAQKIFYSAFHKDLVMWTDTIAGHCGIGDTDGSLRFFHGMFRNGMDFDSFTLSAVLNACAEGATLRQGEVVHCLVVKKGYGSEMSVCGNLVDMYAKNGDLRSSKLVFSLATEPDLKCWNALLGGYGYHGQPEDAFTTFNEMINGLEPDEVTFLSLLSTCSHCGLVSKAKHFWNCMKERGINPGLKHYSSMIALLSRAGLLEEVEEIIITQESSFGDHHHHLLLLLQLEDGTVKETRRKMKDMEIEKDPGFSWLEGMGNKTNVFSSSDVSHPQKGMIEAVLQALLETMTDAGAGEFDLACP